MHHNTLVQLKIKVKAITEVAIKGTLVYHLPTSLSRIIMVVVLIRIISIKGVVKDHQGSNITSSTKHLLLQVMDHPTISSRPSITEVVEEVEEVIMMHVEVEAEEIIITEEDEVVEVTTMAVVVPTTTDNLNHITKVKTITQIPMVTTIRIVVDQASFPIKMVEVKTSTSNKMVLIKHNTVEMLDTRNNIHHLMVLMTIEAEGGVVMTIEVEEEVVITSTIREEEVVVALLIMVEELIMEATAIIMKVAAIIMVVELHIILKTDKSDHNCTLLMKL